MGHRHDADELLQAAVDAVLDGGLGELTFGRLGRRIGVADRTLVYYFKNKASLQEKVLGVLAGDLLERLGAAFGEQRRGPGELLRVAYPVLTTEDADRVFALWFEFAGQAASGAEPQRTLATGFMQTWIDWTVERVEAPSRAQARREALALLATLDGALLMHHLGQAEAGRLAVEVASRPAGTLTVGE